jgi:hypothetical protein
MMQLTRLNETLTSRANLPVQARRNDPPQPQVLSNQTAQRFAQACPLHLPAPGVCTSGGMCHTCPERVQAKPAALDNIVQHTPSQDTLVQRLVPDSGASTNAPGAGITSFSMAPGMVADEVSTAGNPAGHNEGAVFSLTLGASATPTDFAIVQLVRGSITYRDSANNLHYVTVPLHGATVPFHYHNWVVDSVNNNPEFGTTHSPPASISSRRSEWSDEPGISPGSLGAQLPVPTRFKVWFRTGIYRRPIPATVSQFQSSSPTPLAVIPWAMHWRNQGSPPHIVNLPITPQ